MPVTVSEEYPTGGAGETARRYRTKSASVRECKGFAARVAIWVSLMVAEPGCLGHDWLTVFRRAHEEKTLEESLSMPGRLHDMQEETDRRDIEAVESLLFGSIETSIVVLSTPLIPKGVLPSCNPKVEWSPPVLKYLLYSYNSIQCWAHMERHFNFRRAHNMCRPLAIQASIGGRDGGGKKVVMGCSKLPT